MEISVELKAVHISSKLFTDVDYLSSAKVLYAFKK